jgi:hypothetical protein
MENKNSMDCRAIIPFFLPEKMSLVLEILQPIEILDRAEVKVC